MPPPLPAGVRLKPAETYILAMLSPIAPTLPSQLTTFNQNTIASALARLAQYGLAAQTTVQEPSTGIQQTAFLRVP